MNQSGLWACFENTACIYLHRDRHLRFPPAVEAYCSVGQWALRLSYGLYIEPVSDYVLRQEKCIASFKPKYKACRLQLNMGE